MFRKSLLVALIAAATTTLVSAAGAPDFSGSWKLNAAKSDFGPMPAPEKMERTITHAEPNLKVKTLQSGPRGEATTESNYTTDGKESVNDMRGTPVKSVVKWEGEKLTIAYKRETPNGAVDVKESWSLGADGKTMTVDAAITAPQGEFVIKYAFDKVAGGAMGGAETAAKSATAGAAAGAGAAAIAAAGSGAAKAVTAGESGVKAAVMPNGARPNFSGKWKLNVAKSEFGPVPAPEKSESVIEHKDPLLKTTTNQVGAEGEVSTVVTFQTDGTESKNEIRGNPMVSNATWEGSALLINSKLDFQGMEIKIKQRMQLSEDGKTMTQTQQLSTPQGEFEIKTVSEKVN